MNLIVLFITAYLLLIPILLVPIRSGAFGRGSVGVLLKLLFLGMAAAVPAFLMEAGGALASSVLLRLFQSERRRMLVSLLLRYVLSTALIEEGWKHFILRSSTWDKMTMDSVADGIAASTVVGAGFSALMYAAWQISHLVVPADMELLRAAMPDFLEAGAVSSFIFALLYIPSHFGFSGLMGALYGVAKKSEQKSHGYRAGFMLFISFLLPFLVHGACAACIGYGIVEKSTLWMALGFSGELLLALVIGMAMGAARDDLLLSTGVPAGESGDVDFADSEEFAEYAEGAGEADNVYAIGTGAASGRPDSMLPMNTGGSSGGPFDWPYGADLSTHAEGTPGGPYGQEPVDAESVPESEDDEYVQPDMYMMETGEFPDGGYGAGEDGEPQEGGYGVGEDGELQDGMPDMGETWELPDSMSDAAETGEAETEETEL
ncbi:MAG: PrsW family glutamic-type intramembrane protease [Eubacteriales bacterium]|nr:PrsW family glutamic-type intramembrane protease [Eubacteriales bacterium]